MKDRRTVDIRVNFLECLALLFIALRLTGVIAWSWLWVLAPLWLPLYHTHYCGDFRRGCVLKGAPLWSGAV